LYGILPALDSIDTNVLAQMRKCRYLSLSTNKIDKIPVFPSIPLTKLSLGRNCIKKIENLDFIAPTLTELWISCNQIDKLSGIETLSKLKVLYIASNKIDSWDEFDHLKKLPALVDLLFTGNPLEKNTGEDWREQVRQRLPNLKILDGKSMEQLPDLQVTNSLDVK
jgi:dynein light chain 1